MGVQCRRNCPYKGCSCGFWSCPLRLISGRAEALGIWLTALQSRCCQGLRDFCLLSGREGRRDVRLRYNVHPCKRIRVNASAAARKSSKETSTSTNLDLLPQRRTTLRPRHVRSQKSNRSPKRSLLVQPASLSTLRFSFHLDHCKHCKATTPSKYEDLVVPSVQISARSHIEVHSPHEVIVILWERITQVLEQLPCSAEVLQPPLQNGGRGPSADLWVAVGKRFRVSKGLEGLHRNDATATTTSTTNQTNYHRNGHRAGHFF